MRENENRSLNPSAYTTPASVFNTLGVDFDSEKETITDINLKTIAIPAAELSKLDPLIDENKKQNEIIENEIIDVSPHIESTDTLERYKIPQDALLSSDNLMSPRLPPNFPIPCEIINALTQQTHSIDPMYVKMAPTVQSVDQQHFVMSQQPPNLNSVNRQPQYVQNVQYSMYPPNTHFNQQNIPNYMIQYLPNQYGGPPQPIYQSDNSNARSLERNNCLYSSRMNSLERSQNIAVKNSRSTSLTRQLSAGQDVYSSNPSRSTSLERQAQSYNNRTGSLERNQQLPMQIFTGNNNRGGSLERNQSVPADCPQQQNRLGYRGGSLERNQQALLINRVSSLERNAQYQIYKQSKQEEPFQEEIYDFGGANVKSCASIALNKSIAKGIIPANTILPGYQTPPPPYSQHFSSSPSQCSLQQQQMQHQQQQQQNPPPPYTQNSLPRVWNQIPQQQQQNIVKNSPQLAQQPTGSHLMQQQHNMSMAQPLASGGFNPQVGR